MADLSHWDFLNQFTPKEAAALIAGIDPREAIGNSPIAIRIDESTVKTFIAVARGEPLPPDGLLTRELELTMHRDFAPSIFLDATGSTLHGIETLDRCEIVRWLSAIGAKSVYQFDLGSRLPIDAPPEQSPAKPAPEATKCDGPLILKNKRPDLLTPVIEAAQRGETEQFSAAVIWPKLCSKAESKTRPLIGVSPDGIKWTDSNDTIQFLTKNALADRLRRMKNPR